MAKQRKLSHREELTQKVRELNALLRRVSLDEERARNRWTRGHRKHKSAAKNAAALLKKLVDGGKIGKKDAKYSAAWAQTITEWDDQSAKLTRERDKHREALVLARSQLASVQSELAVIISEEAAQARATDEIVNQVFVLNAAVVETLHRRNDFLTRHVFTELIDKNTGKLRRQITFTSTDGLRRVVAMVNTMTRIETHLAEQARGEIDRFFNRFQEAAISPEVKPLYELTEKLLYQKTSFKVGPDLYRFLSMELDLKIFPELARAQHLLRQSIRSEKTDSYVRLWTRRNLFEIWKPLPQS